MSKVYFIGDMHFGHKGINSFRTEFETDEQHNQHLIHQWNSVVRKRDVVYMMGDICFTVDALKYLPMLNGTKRLVLGNHDIDAEHFIPYVDKIFGATYYKHMLLTHIPIHPSELYRAPNIHGHVHRNDLPDSAQYFNVCAEHIGYTPIRFTDIENRLYLNRNTDNEDYKDRSIRSTHPTDEQ